MFVYSLAHGNVRDTNANIGYGYLDGNGDLVNPIPATVQSISRIFYAGSDPLQRSLGNRYDGEQFIAKWDGSATGNVDYLTTGGTQNKTVAGQITFTLGTSPGNTALTLTPTNPNDPPRNISIYQTRYASNVAAGEYFNPDWINLIKPFPILRMMDFMKTNFSSGFPINFSDIATEAYYQWGHQDGPKRGFPISLIPKLAKAAVCERIHINIPEQLNDAGVTAVAMRDGLAGTSIVTQVEYENEPWNPGFSAQGYNITQGTAKFGSDGNGAKFYGYRASQIMKVFRDVFANRARWRGVLAPQTVTPSFTDDAFAGFDAWKAETGSALVTSDLFDAVHVAGYFGDAIPSRYIYGITNASPAHVICGNDFSNGDRIKLFTLTQERATAEGLPSAGMYQLNDTYQTVGNVTPDGFDLVGTNTTALAPYVQHGMNCVSKSKIWDLMDQSATLNASSPGTYPTKFTYFNDQVMTSMMTGTCSFGYTTSDNGTIPGLANIYYPAQYAKALSRNLSLEGYEGGDNMVGTGGLAGYDGKPQLNEYVVNFGHSPQIATIFTASFKAFYKAGGKYPAKFTEAGTPSQYGVWPAVRYLPTTANGNTDDTGNPVWQAVLNFNNNKIPDTYALRFGA